MAGSGLAVGGVAVVAVLTVGVALTAGAGATSQRLAAAADAAALAAADALSGAVPVTEEPCALAARVSGEHATTLQECRIDGLAVRVRVGAVYAGFPGSAGSRAGPAEPAAGRG